MRASRNGNIWQHVDWLTIGLFLVLVIFGWLNIYAACYDEAHAAVFDFSTRHGKQLIWIGISLVIALVITLTEARVFPLWPISFISWCWCCWW